MNQSQRTTRFEIDYAKDDLVVKRCLWKASLYRTLGWMQLGIVILVALIGISEKSGGMGNMSALLALVAAFHWIAESGFRKSAWIRTLELRIEDLQSAKQEIGVSM